MRLGAQTVCPGVAFPREGLPLPGEVSDVTGSFAWTSWSVALFSLALFYAGFNGMSSNVSSL